MPVNGHFVWEATLLQSCFDDARDERCTIEISFVFGHRYECIRDWHRLNQVVYGIVVVGLFEFVCIFVEESPPEYCFDEHKNVDDFRFSSKIPVPNNNEINNFVPYVLACI